MCRITVLNVVKGQLRHRVHIIRQTLVFANFNYVVESALFSYFPLLAAHFLQL
jgi:hypothetical protein